MIVTDLDNTLLRTDKTISDYTAGILNKCRQNGIKVVFATGRPPLLDRMLSWGEYLLSLFDGGIYYNGGCIKIGDMKSYVSIPDEIVGKIINTVKEYEEINIAIQFKDEIHALRFPFENAEYKRWGVTADEILHLDQINNMEAIKILVFNSNQINSMLPINEKLITKIKLICMDYAQFYTTDKSTLVQVMGKDVSKFSGIEKIREIYGLAKEEIAVFGDDTNDMEMLMEYPISFAMGNTEPQVKTVAKYITVDNNNDGVHEAICNILKLL